MNPTENGNASERAKHEGDRGSSNSSRSDTSFRRDWEGIKQRRAAAFGVRKKSWSPVSTVLTQLLSRLGLERRLREHTLVSLWPTIVEPQVAERTRPLFLDSEGKLVVSVRDASTGQELSLRKTELTKSLQKIARGIGIQVTGMRFDLKHFHAPQQGNLPIHQTPSLPEPTNDHLTEVNLAEEQLASLAELRRSLESDSNIHTSLIPRILTAYERELRLKSWRIKNNYPICPSCSEPCDVLHGRKALCADCFYESASQRCM